ncbi:MAG: dienelactone hydrolase family protein [Planctomycetota bacterium]
MRHAVRIVLVLAIASSVEFTMNSRAASCRAADVEVSWLADVQRPPEKPSAFDVGTIQPLLVTEAGDPVRDLAGWNKRREAVRAAWLSFLGPMPAAPANNKIEVLKSEPLPDGTRQLIRYECEAGLFVEAYLLHPDTAKFPGPRPGIVALHPTTASTFDETAGVSGKEPRQLGLLLMRRGFVVICPRCFLWQDAETLPLAVEKFRARHPDTLGMHKMLYDAKRATDVLVAQPNVNAKRIGAVGHSLGAKETLYLAAFDDRIKAAVASEGGLALKSTNWDASWYLGPKIREATFERNHHELLALIAPRAFLILGGESGPGAADGERSWPLIEAALPVYRLYNQSPRVGLLNHRQGHSIPDEAGAKLIEWLENYLN